MTPRWGVIGYGLFGRWHAQLLGACEGARLVAIATASQAGRDQARADHPGCRVVGDWRELLAARDIDAVSIVTPNHLHAGMAIAALEAGKAVLVEKPLATTVEGCERVTAAVARTRGLLSVGFELRFSAQWGAIRRLIDDGAIGRPVFANLALFRFPFRPGGGGWRHDPARVGSWLLEEAVHFYDLLLWYLEPCGAPVRVRAEGTRRADGLVPNLTSTLAFADGAVAVVTQALGGFGHHLSLELVGERGAVRSLWSGADARSPTASFSLRLQRQGSEGIEDLTPPASGELVELEAELAATAVAFAAGRSPVPVDEGRRAVLVCLAAERSLLEGRDIPLCR
jgi:myo-inositol 2-dehydrogenase/D-chiro-inositol 1-dehydrogenase